MQDGSSVRTFLEPGSRPFVPQLKIQPFYLGRTTKTQLPFTCAPSTPRFCMPAHACPEAARLHEHMQA